MKRNFTVVFIIILIAVFVAVDRHDTKRAYGEVVLETNESAQFANATLTLLEVTEDSRCAADVQCIWAGTLKASVRVNDTVGSVELGKSVVLDNTEVQLTLAEPTPQSGTTIGKQDYKLTFNVGEVGPTSPTPVATGKCYVGGCSAQICSDQPDAVSTCEYTAAYACYQGAKCERQVNGACGWTETPELKMCLSNAK